MSTLLQQIEAFLEEFEMSPTAFGTQVLNDPGFVSGLKGGRDPKMSTAQRCTDFILRKREEASSAKQGEDA